MSKLIEAKSDVKKKFLSLLVVVVMLGLAAPAFAADPESYVKRKTDVISKILARAESKARTTELEKVVNETIDFRELASRSLGKHWEARTEEEKSEFLSLLQQLLQANYRTKLSGQKLGKDYEIHYVSAATRDDRAIVKTAIVVKDESKPIAYKLMKKKGADWTIYDIVIDDISLEETYRESYTQIIEDEGWGVLIQRMKERVEQLTGEAPETRGEAKKVEERETVEKAKKPKKK